MDNVYAKDHVTVDTKLKKYDVKVDKKKDAQAYLEALRDQMLRAAADLEFEEAARLRDELTKEEKRLKKVG